MDFADVVGCTRAATDFRPRFFRAVSPLFLVSTWYDVNVRDSAIAFYLVGSLMYLDAFGFHSRPFVLAPNPDQIVWTSGLDDIRRQVLTAIEDHVSLIVLTGDVGAGKTTFLSAIVANGIPANRHIVFLRWSPDNPSDLLRFVAADLPASLKKERSPCDRISETAKRMPLVVILDEAHRAAPEAVLDLYRLAQIEPRLTLILAGQRELRARLTSSVYSGLKVPPEHQHVIALPSNAEAQTYICNQLEQAGGSEELIQIDARTAIVRAAGRVPRKINKVADACLFLAAEEGRQHIDAAFAKHVINDELDPITLALSPSEAKLVPQSIGSARRHHSAKEPSASGTQSTPVLPEVYSLADTPENKSEGRKDHLRSNSFAWIARGASTVAVLFVLFIPTPSAYVSQQSLGLTAGSARFAGPRDLAPLEAATAADTEVTHLYTQALKENNPLQAAIDYSRAGVLGHVRAAKYIGQKYETGDGVSFSPGMAARWYAAAEGRDPAQVMVAEDIPHAIPLRAIRVERRVDLVWDGVAEAFVLELADQNYRPLAELKTALTAASVVTVDNAALWRVKGMGDVFSDWRPIALDVD
jgi:type II secretory pathway predicted ATPase ExeA